MRNSASSLLPQHAAVAGWKHRARVLWSIKVSSRCPLDRGAEQGDVDGPSECSLTFGSVAAEARLRICRTACCRNPPLDWRARRSRRRKTSRRTAQPNASCPQLSAWSPDKSSSERTIRDIFHQKTDAWQTSGTLMVVTFFVTLFCRCPTYKRLKQLTFLIGAERTHRQQKSSTTWQPRRSSP